MKIRSHTFRGKRYGIKFRKIAGQTGSCDPPTEPEKVIYLDPRLRGFEELETLNHEMLHALLWDHDEEAITEMAHDMTRLQWRRGYRRQP